MNKLALVITIAAMVGCASAPRQLPVLVDGNNYLAMGTDCSYGMMSQNVPNQLDCYNEDKKYTGNRKPMTAKELKDFWAIRDQNITDRQVDRLKTQLRNGRGR
jgi:hypothetical protein